GIPQEPRILDRRRADDDVAQAPVDVLLDGVQIPNAAAQLHGDVIADGPENGLDGRVVLRLAGEGPVQVDQMQPSRSLGQPAARHGRGVLAKGGGLVHVALLEAHAVAVFQVNRGDEEHSGGYRGTPWSALFSGWNWVAKILSRAIAAVKRAP